MDLKLFAGFSVGVLLFSTLLSSFVYRSLSVFDISLVIILFGYSHIASTYLRAYLSDEFRTNIWVRWALPALFLAAIALRFSSYQIFLIAFCFLSMFHNIKQQIGLLKIASGRAQAQPSKKEAWINILFFSVFTYMGALICLSDAKQFEWVIGYSPSLPNFLQPYFISIYAAAMGLCILYEARQIQRTGILNFGKYLQYGVAWVCWFVLPLMTSDFRYTYLAHTVSHGIYYLAFTYVFALKEPEKYGAGFNAIKYFGGLIFVSFLLLNLFHNPLLQNHDLVRASLEILTATFSWGHYVLDGFIWKRKNSSRFDQFIAAPTGRSEAA